MEDALAPSEWIETDNVGVDLSRAMASIAINAVIGLCGTWLHSFVEIPFSYATKDGRKKIIGRNGDITFKSFTDAWKKDWKKVVLKPVRDQVSGYVMPSFAKTAYWVIMSMIPRHVHGGQRYSFTSEEFLIPHRYPLEDVWHADNVKILPPKAALSADGSSATKT